MSDTYRRMERRAERQVGVHLDPPSWRRLTSSAVTQTDTQGERRLVGATLFD